MIHPATASQTVGPYFQLGMEALCRADIAGEAPGPRMQIGGRVLDGDGTPVSDALLELWQPAPDGRFGVPGFPGFGRVATGSDGEFQFSTLLPGRVAGADAQLQAPHILVAVFMRGLLRHLVTRIYFPGEPSNSTDPVLGLVPAERRWTLIARGEAGGPLQWNVVLQGHDETVFFDC
jgi:protocatechuate 3,4-dioxygenase, alpha subunit